jgi:hypothetical protein
METLEVCNREVFASNSNQGTNCPHMFVWQGGPHSLHATARMRSTMHSAIYCNLLLSYPVTQSVTPQFQSKALRMIVDAPWYVPNTVIRRDLHTPRVKEEIRRYSFQYSACFSAHPNDLVVNLMELPDNRRLRRQMPTRFLV